jgi:hypothetical protein
MAIVEVFDRKDAITPILSGEFDFMPRLGEILSVETGDYFEYYRVVEIWHRQQGKGGSFRACVRVELED